MCRDRQAALAGRTNERRRAGSADADASAPFVILIPLLAACIMAPSVTLGTCVEALAAAHIVGESPLVCFDGDDTGPVGEFAGLALWTPDWVNGKNLWVAFGFLAQAMFFGRFLLQWIASERKKECVVPIGFWWLSVVGGVMLFAYAVHRRDPVFIAGQGCGLLIYLRNLYFIYAKRPAQGLPRGDKPGALD